MIESGAQRLFGRVAIVTGGASGIGEAIARTFAAHGAAVVIADIAVERGSAVAKEIGQGASFVPLNVADTVAWSGVIDKIVERFGRVDVLVNNAGGGRMIDITEETPEQHHHVLDVNLTGVWAGIRAVVPAMKAAGRGSIVNISSIGAERPSPPEAMYAAAKNGLNALTRAFAQEFAPLVRVNGVMPGAFATDMAASWDDRFRHLVLDRLPAGRLGRPEELASMVVFLASDESGYTTGALIPVDGGRTAVY